MYLPDFLITPKILKNIASIEYGKALIENTTILPKWDHSLKKEATIKTITNNLILEGFNIGIDDIKPIIEKLVSVVPKEIKNFEKALTKIKNINTFKYISELDLKNIQKELTDGININANKVNYRKNKTQFGSNTSNILADIGELMEWITSLNAKGTHPVLVTGILTNRLLNIQPFDSFNTSTTNLVSQLTLATLGYSFKHYLSIENYFVTNKYEYEHALRSPALQEDDLTYWLDLYTEAVALEVTRLKDQVLMLARDTKIAKVSGRILLSDRQERIIEYLQDYRVLKNKDFSVVFPSISEDTVLRDLKELIDKGMVIKVGSTKSSRYELK